MLRLDPPKISVNETILNAIFDAAYPLAGLPATHHNCTERPHLPCDACAENRLHLLIDADDRGTTRTRFYLENPDGSENFVASIMYP